MKKLYFFGLLTIMLLALVGCGDSNDVVQPVFVANIFSDQQSDGDISFDGQTFVVTNSPSILFFGIDDSDPNLPEYRAFLDFPLNGSTGQESVPGDAIIVSATLEVFVAEVSFAAVVPTLIDLVIYPISGGLRPADFDSPPLLTRSVDFFSSDPGTIVSIDVTSLMREAQRLGLLDLQLRFVLDFITDFGFVGIEDRPNVTITAPLLIVEYVF